VRTVVADASAIVEYLLRTKAAGPIGTIMKDADTDVARHTRVKSAIGR
jgi:hypothetical protein